MSDSSFSLGFGASPSPSNNIFGVSSGDTLNGSIGLPQPSLTLPSSSTSHSSGQFNLGLLQGTNDPNKLFHVSKGSDLLADLKQPKIATLEDFLKFGEPKSTESVGALATDIAADLTHLGKVKTAMDIGKGIADVAKAAEESKANKLEDITCKTAKVVSELAMDTVTTGVIVGGTGLLIAESLASPPLAAAIPVAGQLLPQAYANAQQFSKFVGKKAEDDCHLLFSQGKENK